MNARAHAYLDGELPIEQLTAEERSEVARIRGIAQVASESFSVELPHDFADRVMCALPAVQSQPRRFALHDVVRRAQWLFRPIDLQLAVRPAYALGASLLVGAFMLLSPGAPIHAPAGPPDVYVRFQIDAEGARSVHLAGSFTEWSPALELQPAGNGRWTVLVPLQPGVHDYAYVVDGERWLTDPSAPSVSDGFGGLNSRLALMVASAY
jgi:hypothetical protein